MGGGEDDAGVYEGVFEVGVSLQELIAQEGGVLEGGVEGDVDGEGGGKVG